MAKSPRTVLAIACCVLLAAWFGARAGATTPSPHRRAPSVVSQLLGHIGRGQPYDAWLAMAPNGRAAVLWALSPRDAGTPLELAVAPPGGRFGRPQMIGKAPFGPINLALAISDSGAVEVAVAPDAGGLFAIRRSPTGHVYPPQHLVDRRWWIAGLSLAAGPGGEMLLAWDSQPLSAQGGGPDTLQTAWLRRGRITFGRPVTLGPTGGLLHLHQALFVGADTALVSWGNALPPRQEWLSFARVGRQFAPPVTLAASTTQLLADRVVSDGAGGAFVALISMSSPGFQTSLSMMTAHSDGTVSPATFVARGDLQGIELQAAAPGRAWLTWISAGRLHAAAVGASGTSPTPGAIRAPGDSALAIDPGGTGILALAPIVWPKSGGMPVWRISYSLFSTRSLGLAAHTVGVSSAPPQVGIDRKGRALVLWVGSQAAGGPVEVLRVRAR